MPADRDPRDQKREREVHHHETERLAAEHPDASPFEDERGAHEPEDRPGRSDRRAAAGEDQRTGGSREPGDEVEQQVAGASEVFLDRWADEPQDEHVHAEVDKAPVQERGRDEPPPLSLSDADELPRRVDRLVDEHSVLVDPAGVEPHEVGAVEELDQEDEDVHRDQRLRDDRPAPREPADRARCGAARRLGLAACARVIGAANAHGAVHHAVRADATPAVRARDVRLPVRVSVTTKRLRHRG